MSFISPSIRIAVIGSNPEFGSSQNRYFGFIEIARAMPILFIYKGKNWWQGDKNSILSTDNPEINNFVYASDFMKEIKAKMQEKNTRA